MLLDAGFVTVCAGGGGVPVMVEKVEGGRILARRHGVEAVIDKVLASAALSQWQATSVQSIRCVYWSNTSPRLSAGGRTKSLGARLLLQCHDLTTSDTDHATQRSLAFVSASRTLCNITGFAAFRALNFVDSVACIVFPV